MKMGRWFFFFLLFFIYSLASTYGQYMTEIRVLLPPKIEYPTLDAKGKHFLYLREKGGKKFIYRCDLNGRNEELFYSQGFEDFEDAAWISWSPSKKGAVLAIPISSEESLSTSTPTEGLVVGTDHFRFVLIDLEKGKFTYCPKEIQNFVGWADEMACFWNRWEAPRNLLMTTCQAWNPIVSPDFEEGNFPDVSYAIKIGDKLYFFDLIFRGKLWGYDLKKKCFFRASFPSYHYDFSIVYWKSFNEGIVLYTPQPQALWLVGENNEDQVILHDEVPGKIFIPISNQAFYLLSYSVREGKESLALYLCKMEKGKAIPQKIFEKELEDGLGGPCGHWPCYDAVILGPDGKNLYYEDIHHQLLAISIPKEAKNLTWVLWLAITLGAVGLIVSLICFLWRLRKRRVLEHP